MIEVDSDLLVMAIIMTMKVMVICGEIIRNGDGFSICSKYIDGFHFHQKVARFDPSLEQLATSGRNRASGASRLFVDLGVSDRSNRIPMSENSFAQPCPFSNCRSSGKLTKMPILTSSNNWRG